MPGARYPRSKTAVPHLAGSGGGVQPNEGGLSEGVDGTFARPTLFTCLPWRKGGGGFQPYM